jgi:hypothetical protein
MPSARLPASKMVARMLTHVPFFIIIITPLFLMASNSGRAQLAPTKSIALFAHKHENKTKLMSYRVSDTTNGRQQRASKARPYRGKILAMPS